jgi:hypothetical protein
MPKKYPVTKELANIYPSWSRTRTDAVSVGQRYLNSFGGSLDRMEKSLEKGKKNTYLTTANIDEIDITHRVLLPRDFEFDLDTTDPLEYCPVPPTASGLHLGEWHTINLAPNNKVSSFWYEALPTRISIEQAVSGVDDELLTMPASDAVVSGEWKHHLADTEINGGHLWVEATGGAQYVTINEDKSINRGRVRLTGRTRKGSFEREMLVFAWDQKQRTDTEWEYITKVDIFDMEDDVQIDIRSSDIAVGPYMDFWNTEFSDNRNKIDTFWDLTYDDGIATLSKINYITDEWQQLILGFSNKDVKERWELLDNTLFSVSGVDMAVQPFTDRAWVVTVGGMLYCYDLLSDQPDNLPALSTNTPGSHVVIEVETPSVVLGQDIEFIPWHARPLQEIRNYRVWYKTPSGTEVELDDVTLVEGTKLTRSIKNYVSITTTERGTYLIGITATFVDGTSHTHQTLVPVNYKVPLAELDLTPHVPDLIEGLEFDSDQKLWVRTTTGDFYQVRGHADLMVIDYEQKIIYFREDYEEVDIGED